MDLSAERDSGLAAAVALAEGAGALLMERFGRLAERNISAMQKAYEETMVREGAK